MNISHELAASSEQKLLPERWVTQNESYDKRLTKKHPGIFKLTSLDAVSVLSVKSSQMLEKLNAYIHIA